MTKLHDLYNEHGQAVWLDFISREFIESGDLDRRIEQGVRGLTSNPTIFEKAISSGEAYHDQLEELRSQDISAKRAYEALVIQDIQNAADRMDSVYKETDGLDGYVSLEVNPHLAYKTDETIEEVQRLHKKVDRRNVMFKVPATSEGVHAVEALIGQGININITLMFSITHYIDVATAYLDGLETYQENGGDLAQVASVASFFVSRVDAQIDTILGNAEADHLKGKIALANAKNVYARFRETFSGERWDQLANAGARVQRPLWASTSTKNPDYPDTLYVDNLIGPDTVNTMPPETLDAFLDHGTIARTVDQDMDAVETQLEEILRYGINLLPVCERLQGQGVDKFIEPYDSLLDTITRQANITV